MSVADSAVSPRDGPMSRLSLFINSGFSATSGPRNKVLQAARCRRRGTAVVELAFLLPLLVMLFVITVDFARVFYFSLTLTNCARAGALYASDPVAAVESPFPNVQSAALADCTNITPQPTITSANGVDASGRTYVAVTANYSFNTVAKFP